MFFIKRQKARRVNQKNSIFFKLFSKWLAHVPEAEVRTIREDELTDGVDPDPGVLHPTHHGKITRDIIGMNFQSPRVQEMILTADGPKMASRNLRTEVDIITVITNKVEEVGEVWVKIT